MAKQIPDTLSYAEYAALERAADDVKHELVDGQMVAMSGVSVTHAQLETRLPVLLHGRLGADCTPLSSGLRVHVESSGNSYYPDLSIVCGPVETLPEDDHALINPTVLVEVLSPSTQTKDRGKKGPDYRTLPSLTDLLFIAQDRRHIEHWQRTDVGWNVRELTDGELTLTGGAGFALDALYDGIV